ncbi:hypothetical protein SLA2020_451440 [Shorea laevis]
MLERGHSRINPQTVARRRGGRRGGKAAGGGGESKGQAGGRAGGGQGRKARKGGGARGRSEGGALNTLAEAKHRPVAGYGVLGDKALEDCMVVQPYSHRV